MFARQCIDAFYSDDLSWLTFGGAAKGRNYDRFTPQSMDLLRASYFAVDPEPVGPEFDMFETVGVPGVVNRARISGFFDGVAPYTEMELTGRWVFAVREREERP